MKTLLTANLSTKTAGDGAGDWSPPAFSFGESFTLALRFTQDVAGQTLEPVLDVRRIAAAVGFVDARPVSGTFALQVGPGTGATTDDPPTTANTTAALQHDCSAAAMAAAINALTGVVASYGTAAVKKADGSWFIVFGNGANEVPLQLRNNELTPLALGRVNASAVDGVWTHELRLVQLPVAYTDTSDRVLPTAPTITRITAGGNSGAFKWDEVQALFVPPDFRDTFSLQFGVARTAQLSVADTTDTIQSALQAVLGDNISVTAGAPFTANLEFTNSLGGVAQDLMTVLTVNPPPLGDLTFTLEFTSAELLAALRTAAAVTLPLEVRIWIDDALTEIMVFRQDVTILQPVQWPDLATTPRIDWLRAPSPKSYLPFSPGGVVTGAQQYNAAFGDGAATEFSFNHGLATELLAAILVRENHDNGRVLAATEYDVEIVSANEVKLTFAAAPAAAALAVTISSSTPISALAAHHHTIADIDLDAVTLEQRLEALETRVTTIEALLPSTAPSVAAATGTGGLSIAIADKKEIFPGRFAANFNVAQAMLDGTGLPRAGALLPAIHTATVGDVGASIGAASARTGVFANRIDVGVFTVAHSTDAHLVNCTAHGRSAGDVVRFIGTLPTPLAADTDYYVIATGLVTNAFEVSATSGGSAITFTSDGSGHAQRAGADQSVGSGLGHRSFDLAPWGLVASDGRVWYAVTQPTDALANWVAVGAFTVVFATNAHLVNCTAHGRSAGDVVRFTGTLPAPLMADTNYFVIATGLVTNAFEISASNGGAAITFTSDGNGEVQQVTALTSYYPSDAERTLFTLPISPEMLPASHELTVTFAITLALLANTSDAQIVVAIEVGTAPEDASPATTGANLQNVVWNPEPLLAQRVVLTDQAIEHQFGAQILRAADGSFTAQGLKYSAWTASSQVPANPTFLLRARLIEFDTEDSIPTARGFVSYDFHGANAGIA